MAKEKIELTLQDESGQEYVAYPFVESEDVTLSNGMDIETMIAQDVSMPIVTHEETSFKVGVGDSDISNSIVDSSVANMTIKGQTYQNILPDPTLRNSMTDGKTMQKLNEGYESVNTVDGVCKSAILSGQTLVNGVTERDYLYGENVWALVMLNNITIQPNKKYIAIIQHLPDGHQWAITNNDGNNLHSNYTKKLFSVFQTLGTVTNQLAMHINVGGVTTVTLEQLKKVRPMIIEYQEGMENWDIPYFEGMQSVKMPVLTTTGKNLFDGEFELDKYLKKDGTLSGSANWATTKNYISVRPNTTYTQNIRMNSPVVHVIFYDKNKNIVGAEIGSDVNNFVTYTTPNNCYYIKTCYDYSSVGNHLFQVEEGSTSTAYEPYKSNILTVNEEVTLRGIGDVKDELNCLTGEVTERIKEVVLNGSEDWTTRSGGTSYAYFINNFFEYNNVEGITSSFKFIKGGASSIQAEESICSATLQPALSLFTNKDELSTVENLKTYLSRNPVTIQYKLEEGSTKTVDLSSSGNWEKVVLDGSEYWKQSTANNNYFMETSAIKSNYNTGIENLVFSDDHCLSVAKVYTLNTDTGLCVEKSGGLRIRTQQVLEGQSIEDFKAYLSQNPITVYYQTATHQDSTQVKQPIFFKDGHIQLSSGVDNSLIPTLDYEAKTSNSYLMDLMKANTRYTMKSKSASGTFTIDGTSYGAGTNGTFTTPSSMTNKLLVMSNKTNEEVMILEGDVTSKTIPYFKGIKSTFEGEDKIEVLSTGKNLFDITKHDTLQYIEDCVTVTKWYDSSEGYSYKLKPNTKYTLSFSKYDTNSSWIGVKVNGYYTNNNNGNYRYTFTTNSTGETTITIGANGGNDIGHKIKNIQLEESQAATTYKPLKQNITKIPLLSSLQTVVENVHMTQGSLDNATGAELVDTTCVRSDFIEVVEDTTIVFRNGGLDRMAHILAYDSEKQYVEKLGIVSSCSIPKDRGIKYVRIFMNMNNYEKLTISKSVKAYKGLASLPNGVHDEIILDRENNKAKIIQRVGKVTYDGTDVWGAHTVHNNNVRIQTTLPNCVRRDTAGFVYAICDKLPSVIWNYSWLQNYNLVTVNLTNLHLQLSDTTMTKQQMLSWLTQNPITVQYELAEPVVTEVDLSGFPYIYKDGHIFLNTDIEPTSEITYSINQQQQIEANNQDLMRHEKKITNLHKLIGTYVNVEYESTLLALNLELK